MGRKNTEHTFDNRYSRAWATARGGQAHAVAGRMSVMALTEHHFCIFEGLFWKIADHPAL